MTLQNTRKRRLFMVSLCQKIDTPRDDQTLKCFFGVASLTIIALSRHQTFTKIKTFKIIILKKYWQAKILT